MRRTVLLIGLALACFARGIRQDARLARVLEDLLARAGARPAAAE